MRNLLEYPITKDEIVACLQDFMAEAGYERDHRSALIGDMRPLLLEEAIKHVRGSTLKLSDLGTVQAGCEELG